MVKAKCPGSKCDKTYHWNTQLDRYVTNKEKPCIVITNDTDIRSFICPDCGTLLGFQNIADGLIYDHPEWKDICWDAV